MVENVEMTGIQEEDTMQVDEISQQPPQQDLLRRLTQRTSILMFPKLDSKLCIATVLSYLIAWEDLPRFFSRLNKLGSAYYEQHKAQFRHFINDRPVPRMAVTFGPKSFQSVLPFRFARLDFLEFAYIQDDLHVMETFAKGTLMIKRLHIGNRGFKLFRDASVSDVVGLNFPPELPCTKGDRGNLSTMVQLLKKSKTLSMDRIKTTEPALQLINALPRAFPNLLGLRLEYLDDVYDTFMRIPDEVIGRLTELGLAVSIEDEGNNSSRFLEVAQHMITKTCELRYLRIAPLTPPASWVEVLAQCAPSLGKLEALVIGAGTPPIEESLRRMQFLAYGEDIWAEALRTLGSEKIQKALNSLSEEEQADFFCLEKQATEGDLTAQRRHELTGTVAPLALDRWAQKEGVSQQDARSALVVLMRRYEWLRILDATHQDVEEDEVPFSRKKPYGQKKYLAELVHSEYARHASTFMYALMKLKTLKIDDGYFSFKTAAFFPTITTLKIKGTLNPDPNDRLSDQQMSQLQTLAVTKLLDGNLKMQMLIKQASMCPKLTSFTLDLARIPLKATELIRLLSPGGPKLRKLALQSVDFQGTDVLEIFGCLANHQTLESLELSTFNLFTNFRCKPNEELKIDFDTSVKNTFLKKLKIRSSKKQFMLPNWQTFILMFSRLQNLTLSGVKLPRFTSNLLESLPLKTLVLQKIDQDLESFNSLVEHLGQNQQSTLQELSIDVGFLTSNLVNESLAPMLRVNNSLTNLTLFQPKLECVDTCNLLRAIGEHPKLERVNLKAAKLGCVQVEELQQQEQAILEMARQPTQLKAVILEPIFSSTSAMSELALDTKQQIIRNLREQLPHLQRIQI